MSKKTKKVLLLILKIAAAAALLWWVLSGMQWEKFFEALKGANIALLLVALVGYMGSLVTIAIRLWYLMRVQEISIRLWEVIRLTFLGQFFNAVVPGTVGGDLVKAYHSAKHTPHKGAAIITVFIDRLLGLTGLALLAAVMIVCLLAAGQKTPKEMQGQIIAAGAALGTVAMMMVFLFSTRFRRILHLEKLYRRLSIAHHIDSAIAGAHRFRQNIGALIAAIGITLIAHVIWIASVVILAEALHLEVPWYNYFVYIPLIYIIGSVPVTPGGLGVVETAYIAFFASSGISNEQIMALALLARLLDIARGIPGAIVVVTGTRVPKAETMESELQEQGAENNDLAQQLPAGDGGQN